MIASDSDARVAWLVVGGIAIGVLLEFTAFVLERAAAADRKRCPWCDGSGFEPSLDDAFGDRVEACEFCREPKRRWWNNWATWFSKLWRNVQW